MSHESKEFVDLEIEFEARVAQFGEDAVYVYDFSGMTAEVLTDDGANATVLLAGEYTIAAPASSDKVIPVPVITGEGDEEVLKTINGDWCINTIQ